MTQKRVLRPDRIRRPPKEGFSWVDRRFLHEYAPSLSGGAILLYLFLCAVSDQHGLSYWGDAGTATRLRMRSEEIGPARDELVAWDLVAYTSPLYQVLALPSRTETAGLSRGGAPQTLAGILGELGSRLSSESSS